MCCGADKPGAETPMSHTPEDHIFHRQTTGGNIKLTKAAKKRAGKRRAQARSKKPVHLLFQLPSSVATRPETLGRCLCSKSSESYPLSTLHHSVALHCNCDIQSSFVLQPMYDHLMLIKTKEYALAMCIYQ